MSATTTTRTNEQLAEAVALANVPTLLMVLVQMTGDKGWLQAPYKPSRGNGLGDNDSGGLSEEIQQEIRDATLEAIMAWRAGRPLAIPQPSDELLVEMLSSAMGEPVPAEYGNFTASLLGQQPVSDDKIDVPDDFHVLIVGAGVSGICAAVNLKAAGVPFTVLEKNPQLGGVWQENRYPGAGVDTPNHLYSYSFAMHDWSMYFALRNDLHGYLQHVAEQHELAPYIRCNTSVETATYDEKTQLWQVESRDGDGNSTTLSGNVLISANGIFNPPVKPNIDGLGDFSGPAFHTAEWRDDVSLDGKDVAIIGNGATCMPALAALGRTVRPVPQTGPGCVARDVQRSTALPGLVSRASGLDVQRSSA